MEKKVFEIREFSLIGKTLHTFEERKDLIFDVDQKVFRNLEGQIQKPTHYFSLTTDLSVFEKESLFPAEIELLPYKAKVIQDLPPSVAKYLEPTEYPNCQLMAQTHGGYLQFKNLDDGEVLRIAMNSNYYEPIK